MKEEVMNVTGLKYIFYHSPGNTDVIYFQGHSCTRTIRLIIMKKLY